LNSCQLFNLNTQSDNPNLGPTSA